MHPPSQRPAGIAFGRFQLLPGHRDLIADGFLGRPMGAMNLAGVLPWTYVRAFGVVALLVLGNVFCLSCPFMLPREVGKRLGLARLNWPRKLRSKWIAILLMIFFV